MSMSPKKTVQSDFCVVGGGSGGLSFAAGAVQMGASVILVEEGKMGGDCLNTGCVPSKALLAAAKKGYAVKNAIDFGWSVSVPTVNFKAVNKHVHDVIASIAPHDSVERFEKLGVRVISERGHFADEHTLETRHYAIRAKRYIIATGSRPFIPPVSGLDTVAYYTNENIFDLQTLPKHLAIIGGGPIGIEMAQAFMHLGSQVTVLEAFTALPKDDQEITAMLKDILKTEGIDLQEHVQIDSVRKSGSKIEVHFTDSQKNPVTITPSHLLVAAGRQAAIQNLNLEAAGIKSTPRGIIVDEYLRTTNRRVYAIGDCTGGYQFTHVAGYHAGLVMRNAIFKMRSKVQTTAIPWVTYTDPELAHAGYTHHQLVQKNIPFTPVKLSFDQNDRARAERKTKGVMKALISSKGKILGVTILGANAGELLYPWVIGIQNNLKASAIAASIAPYPTFSEMSKRLAGSYYTPKLFSPRMKKIVHFLMRFTR